MKTKIRKEPLEFKVYEKSNLFYEDYKGLLERYYFKTEKEQKECKTKIFFTDEEEREVTKYIGLK